MTDEQKSGSALVREKDDAVEGVHIVAEVINAHLKHAASEMNLIAPATRVGQLPPGFGVSLAVIRVNPYVDNYGSGPDCYKVTGGKLALSKHKIDQIGAAVGVSWDPHSSGRTDDGTRPGYWSYRAVGVYRQYDGNAAMIQNEYEWDVTNDSPRIEEMRWKAEGDKKKMGELESNIRQLRKFGLARAVTGARLRALCDIGFKRAYTVLELQKPFAVARLHYTGRTGDVVLDRQLALQTAAAHTGATSMMYGGGQPVASPALQLPAMGEDPNADYREAGEELEEDPVYRIPDGKHKGMSIHDADVVTLQYWGAECEDEDLSSAIATELHKRSGGEKL